MPRHHPYGGYDDGPRQHRGSQEHRRSSSSPMRGRGGRGGRSRTNYAQSPFGASPANWNMSPSATPFPPWGAPFPMAPMSYGLPYVMFGGGTAEAARPPPTMYGSAARPPMSMPMPAPMSMPVSMPSSVSPGAPMFPWNAKHMPMSSPNLRRGGGPRAGRGGHSERKSQRSRFTRSIYQPDPDAERPEDSKPCRTLFVRNVAFEVDVHALRADFASFGEIRVWFDLIHRRGMLFVTYYDIRAAEKARVAMNQKAYVGRTLDVHFSLPKDEDQEQHCDREKNQGTLFVVVQDATEPVTYEAFHAHFEPYGEIRAIRTYKEQEHTRFVEYWDSRACVAAHDTLQDSEFLGGRTHVKFAWDLSTVSLVNDARTRSEAKAAAEARARADHRQSAAPLPMAAMEYSALPDNVATTTSTADAAPAATGATKGAVWPGYDVAIAPEARLEQAQRVQKVRTQICLAIHAWGALHLRRIPRTRLFPLYFCPLLIIASCIVRVTIRPGANQRSTKYCAVSINESADIIRGGECIRQCTCFSAEQ